MKAKLKLAKRQDGWWITNWPEAGFDDCGPYPTKPEADEARVGLGRTLEHWEEWGFWTTERSTSRKAKAVQ